MSARGSGQEHFLELVEAEKTRRTLVWPSPQARRNAFTGDDWDPLRAEFLRVMEVEFQPELQDLARFLSANPSEPSALGVLALLWFARKKLCAPWLLSVLDAQPERFLRGEVSGGVRIWLLGGPELERHAPVKSIAAPEPWAESEAAFKERCDRAWETQSRWLKEQGFKPPKKSRRRGSVDRTPQYLQVLLARSLRPRITWEQHAEKLGLEDHKTLEKRVKELRARLKLGGKHEMHAFLKQMQGA